MATLEQAEWYWKCLLTDLSRIWQPSPPGREGKVCCLRFTVDTIVSFTNNRLKKVVRKLLLILNAVIRDLVSWSQDPVPTAIED